MEDKLLECIQYSLNHYLWHNAVFLAERLYAESPTEAHLHTLATCYYKAGKTNRAYWILKSSSSQENKYLFAICCFELSKLKEAELALTSNVLHDPASLYLLGLIYKKGNQRERAIVCLKESLKLFPYMWTAFECLCALGDDIDPGLFFVSDAPTNIQMPPPNPVLKAPISHGSLSTPITPATPLNVHTQPSPIPMQLNSPMHEFATPSPSITTPIPTPTPPVGPSITVTTTPSPGWSLKGNSDDVTFSTPPSSFVTPTPNTPVQRAKPAVPANKRKPEDAKRKQPRTNLFTDQAPGGVRRSARLSFGSVDNPSFVKSGAPSSSSTVNGNDKAFHKRDKDKRRVKGRPASNVAPNINAHQQEDEYDIDNTIRLAHNSYNPYDQQHGQHTFNNLPSQQGATELLSLLRVFGLAYRHVSMYRCKDALVVLQQLSPAQARTGWALTLAGRAHFELVDYRTSLKFFEEARRIESHRLEGMEIYSTVLWHLRRETDLSHLAHTLVEFDHLDPRAWCAVGNCFSLQKDHDTALKMFRRALQLDPYFTYAHTLSGHEYVANDDLDKALASYRSAIRIDPRHYNAWYGLGMIYFRQEKYKLAEFHFRRALSINGTSTVLYCYVGMVLNENKQYLEALQMLEAAISLDSKNTLARYKKAQVLASLHETQAALTELEALRDTAPREASIYTLLAKLYRQSRQPYKALSALAAAADLDPKNASNLKAAMERITNPLSGTNGDLDEDDSIL